MFWYSTFPGGQQGESSMHTVRQTKTLILRTLLLFEERHSVSCMPYVAVYDTLVDVSESTNGPQCKGRGVITDINSEKLQMYRYTGIDK